MIPARSTATLDHALPRLNYRDLTKERLVELLEARDRKKFGLVWEREDRGGPGAPWKAATNV